MINCPLPGSIGVQHIEHHGTTVCTIYTVMLPIQNIIRLSDFQTQTLDWNMNSYQNIRFEPSVHAIPNDTNTQVLVMIESLSYYLWNKPNEKYCSPYPLSYLFNNYKTHITKLPSSPYYSTKASYMPPLSP